MEHAMGKRLTTEEFIERAKNAHGDTYDYSLVEYENNRTKVEIICPKHGIFNQTPSDHLNGHGCPRCRHRNRKYTKEEFIEKAIWAHGRKYKYDKVSYVNKDTKVRIICPYHGEFEQTPSMHLQGQGCPKCANEFRADKLRLSNHEFISLARQAHNDTYDYSKAQYIDTYTEVEIICPKHGKFHQTPTNHLAGKGCPQCGIEKAFASKKEKGTINSSRAEDELYEMLRAHFGDGNVNRHHRDDTRYPWACDFYIVPMDMFVELNAHWTHGGHWFDEHDENDMMTLAAWESKGTDYYSQAIRTWTVNDTKKRSTASGNKLNYVALWNDMDIKQWSHDGFPKRRDYN